MSDANDWKEESEAVRARQRKERFGKDDDIDRGYMTCPLCDAEIPVSEEEIERSNDVYCSFCQVEYKVRKDPEDEPYLEADF